MEQTIDLSSFIRIIGLPFWLLIASSILAVTASLWLMVAAFKESILWGLGVVFVPFVPLIFIAMRWHVAKKPFFISLLAGGLTLIAVAMMAAQINSDNPETAAFPARLRAEQFGDFSIEQITTPKPSTPAPTPAPSRAEVAAKLQQLKILEQQLQAQKAALDPNDKAEARQLALAIEEYNNKLRQTQQMAAPYRQSSQSTSPAKTR